MCLSVYVFVSKCRSSRVCVCVCVIFCIPVLVVVIHDLRYHTWEKINKKPKLPAADSGKRAKGGQRQKMMLEG